MQGQFFTTKVTFCVHKKVPEQGTLLRRDCPKVCHSSYQNYKDAQKMQSPSRGVGELVQLQGDYRREGFHCMFSVWPVKTKFKHFCLRMRSDQDSLKYIRSKVSYFPEGLLY